MKYAFPVTILIFFLTLHPASVSAQDSIAHSLKRARIWVYTDNNSVLKGVLVGASDTVLFVYQGSINAYKKEDSAHLMRISYTNISMIKTKKSGGILKGLLIGGGIGLAPAFFGEGGAYVAVFTFPAGLITGTIVGATSKKKYTINGNAEAFAHFSRKWVDE